VVCAVFTTANATLVNRFAAGKWGATFTNIGGTAAGEPACTSLNQNGNVACFVEGSPTMRAAPPQSQLSWSAE